MLKTIFKIAQAVFPCLINVAVSKLKVENVLRPPQMPVKTKTFSDAGVSILSEKYLKAITKMSEALTFANKVEMGSAIVER
jgi:hypothetical protein